MKAAVNRAMTILRVETGLNHFKTGCSKSCVEVILAFERRSIDTVLTLVVKDGENEYDAGSVAMAAEEKTGFTSMASIPADLSGKLIDVILRPDPNVAEKSVDPF